MVELIVYIDPYKKKYDTLYIDMFMDIDDILKIVNKHYNEWYAFEKWEYNGLN